MEKNRRPTVDIGEIVGKTAIEVMKNGDARNTATGVMGMLFPYAGVTKQAVDLYIDEIKKSNLLPEVKTLLILNVKKTIKGLKNQKTIADIAMKNAKAGTDFSDKSGVNEEWLDRFMDSARFVSSESIQIIWGKILANEFETPGATPPNMIRILSEFTPDLAKIFGKICSMKVLLCPLSEQGDIEDYVPRILVPYIMNEEKMSQLGLTFDMLNELEILGVIKQEILKGYIIQGVENEKIIISINNELELISEHEKDILPIGNVLLTSVGKALQKIIDVEDIPGYRDMVKEYLKVSRVQLVEKHDYIVKNEGDEITIQKE